MKIFASIMLLTAFVLLTGCVEGGKLRTLAPVCEALGDPIEYNSRSIKSDYHAGPKLAPRLDTQNQVGVNLNCPAYK
jgi:hypothetical protein